MEKIIMIIGGLGGLSGIAAIIKVFIDSKEGTSKTGLERRKYLDGRIGALEKESKELRSLVYAMFYQFIQHYEQVCERNNLHEEIIDSSEIKKRLDEWSVIGNKV